MKIAVFDLGTNVFNMLLAEVDGSGRYSVIAEKKAPAKIGEGIKDRFLTEEAYSRASKAIGILVEAIRENGGADRIAAYGTSALRDARNGGEFVRRLGEEHGFEISIIPGIREAELIYKGVRYALEKTDETFMILDIGGGSNEFIIADNSGILWKQSFQLGMSRLRNIFTPSDPITAEEIEKMLLHCDSELADLWTAISRFQPSILIGTSGSFDTFRDVILKSYGNDGVSMEMTPEMLNDLFGKLIPSTRKEREAMPGMSEIRIDYITLAAIFTDFILKRTGIRKIYQSSYSLKEGGMAEFANIKK